MDEKKLAVILGALLHDIGKFMQRAELEKDFPDIKSNYNEFCPTPTSYLHSAHSAFFVERFLPGSLANNNIKKELYNACRHHCDPQIEDIYKMADRLSAGMERFGEVKQNNKYKTVRLRSIFDNIEMSFSIKDLFGNYQPRWYYPLTQLNWKPDIFPRHEKKWKIKGCTVGSESPVQEYNDLWNQFIKELEELKPLQNDNYHFIFNELFYLLQKYTWCIPSATNVFPADISLFDHLKTTAAIAACIYDSSMKGFEDDREFLLMGADISGIQSFIFRIARSQGIGGISKRLRGRSFYLMMLSEIICRHLLSSLDLTPANINFCGGGNMELLLPNTKNVLEWLNRFECEINEWLLNEFKGQLAINVAKVPMSQGDLNSNFGAMKNKLQNRLSLAKKHKFKEQTGSKNFWIRHEKPLSSPVRICRSCNLMQAPDSDVLCSQCSKQKKIGEVLPKTKALLFLSGMNEKNTNIPYESITFGNFGTVCLLKKEESLKPGVNNCYAEMLSINFEEHVSKGFYCLSNILPTTKREMVLETEKDLSSKTDYEREGRVKIDQTLSFTTIAKMAEGDSKLGLLKMDVDNLGQIFSIGFRADGSIQSSPSRFLSISRVSTLSRELTYFLNGLIAWACEQIAEKWKNNSSWGSKVRYNNSDISNIFYVVFSGGDDLFIIGPWDQIITLAHLIRSMFKDFTCHNPNFTISAGIFICKPKYPISLAAKKVEEALERSKVRGKNRITLFGDTVSWNYEDKEKSRIFDDTIMSRYTTFESSEIGSETIQLSNKPESIEEMVVPLTRLVKFQEHLLSLYKSKKMPRGFVHRLIEGQKMFFPKIYNLDKEREEEIHNAMIFPYLFYIMNRNLAPDVRQDLQQDLITGGEAISVLRQIKIPASMFLMKTRTS